MSERIEDLPVAVMAAALLASRLPRSSSRAACPRGSMRPAREAGAMCGCSRSGATTAHDDRQADISHLTQRLETTSPCASTATRFPPLDWEQAIGGSSISSSIGSLRLVAFTGLSAKYALS
jgi:hypothetical protein